MHDGGMAGGMNKRGSWGPMSERIAGLEPPEPPTERLPDPPSPARHCFVDGQPSLLVEWRQGVAGWEGRVITLRWLDGEGWAVVEQWLQADSITSGADLG
jgi:hypothetical protein